MCLYIRFVDRKKIMIVMSQLPAGCCRSALLMFFLINEKALRGFDDCVEN